jgi:serine/threonine protein kinase
LSFTNSFLRCHTYKCSGCDITGSRGSNIRFDWRTRVKIAVGVARGIAFLHEEIRPPIIHRDIKASNILLDKDLTPKISDFGLARLLPPNATHVSTRVAGTLGYLAPEYAIRGQVTKKSDIYSFGVLLLEIVSGRCNTNTRLPYEDQFLLERVSSHHQTVNNKMNSVFFFSYNQLN